MTGELQVHTFHTLTEEVGNSKPPDSDWCFTRFTDFTPVVMEAYVAPPRTRPPGRPPAPSPTPSSITVKSVNSVKSNDVNGWFSPPCRETGCEFHAEPDAEVAA